MPAALEQLGVRIDFQFVFIFATLIWTRTLTMVAVVPFLFGKPVPMPVRVGASAVLALFAYPHLVPAASPEILQGLGALIGLYLKEAFIGLTIGFTVAMIFYGFEAAGGIIDDQRGMSIARVLIPELGSMGSLGGQFLFGLAVVTYLTIGGHLFFFKAFFESFALMPVLAFPDVGPGLMPLIDFFLRITGHVFVIAFQIATPVIIAVLVADIILGVANRVAPQINVWELGFTLKGYIGVLMLALTLTVIYRFMEIEFARSTQYTNEAVKLLEGKVPQPPPTGEQPPQYPPPPGGK
ncbi:MAG: flagellar biosynthetic protein FliR [Deltaproteobacteria bacterium]|nr:flagellar biosynthetic protein FliR [Deltaproteobacteria bacterium]